jgi:hypothetical protein
MGMGWEWDGHEMGMRWEWDGNGMGWDDMMRYDTIRHDTA